MKTCKDCLEQKTEEEFYGVQNECKDCTKKRVALNPNAIKYDKTEKGVIRIIYKTQKSNSKRRGHDAPSYTKDELKHWLYENGFKKIYDVWVSSGYKKDLKPSVDRINDFKKYSIPNIQLGTWADNKHHQHSDVRKGIGTSGERCMSVIQLTNDDKFVNEFVSISEAKRITGICNIDRVCKKERSAAGGYKWKYKNLRVC